MITVTGFASVNSGEAVRVSGKTGDGEKFGFLVPSEIFHESGISEGVLPDEVLDLLSDSDKKYRAFCAGRRLLEYGSNSAGQLEFKLIKKGHEKSAASYAAAKLCSLGLINEKSDVIFECDSLIRRGYGRMRIMSRLRAESYSEEALKEASSYLRNTDFSEEVSKVVKKKWGTIPSDPAARKKAVAALYRLGFTSDDIRSVL